LTEPDRPRFRELRDRDLINDPGRRAVSRWAIQESDAIAKEIETGGLAKNLEEWIDHIQGDRIDHTRWSYDLTDQEVSWQTASSNWHDRVLPTLLPDWVKGHDRLDFYNMTDRYLQGALNRPGERVERILDFGAGFGRQIATWDHQITYVAMDAIEVPYLLQRAYFLAGGVRLVDYMDDPEGFRIQPDRSAYHLPTWRDDLLPDGFFDRVLCVQVLGEIPDRTFIWTLKLFARVLRPGGQLYIRDHNRGYQPGHRQLRERCLRKAGFALRFRPDLEDYVDVHGLPEIWTIGRKDGGDAGLKGRLRLARAWYRRRR
jgi:SAM-dependent methyltransferase